MRGYLYASLLIFTLVGCTPPPEPVNKQTSLEQAYGSGEKVEDLHHFPQDMSAYRSNIIEKPSLLPTQQNYDIKYFEPWTYTKPPIELKRVLWPFTSYTHEIGFDATLQPIPEAWFQQISTLSNFEAYGKISKPAVSLRYLNVRNFPTEHPLFKDPKKAGEGFPFDYLQNSGVHPNEPLFVSHLSQDGKWAYIFTSYITGWVDSRDIAYLSKPVIDEWMNARQIEIIDERHSIYDLKGRYVFSSRIGMRLPLIAIEDDHYVALAITAAQHHRPVYTKVNIPFTISTRSSLRLNKENLSRLSGRLLEQPYGWGGLYEERDCSSTLRDLFAPFGLWLPRNSSEQSKIGKIISLAELDEEAKKAKILSQAVPFETLLYKKGHILLYLGLYEGEIAVFHNVWGLKTIKDGAEGRDIIGKTVITSLNPGKELENYNQEKSILSQIESMNIITQD